MKTRLFSLVAMIVASPALAHVDNGFHSHGIENTLILALVAAAGAIFALRR
ncbi:hypothetical protein [Cognatishimia maritima]|uniref:MYXO-CTERM domain-containing protein n=1 Tax=Cognatishimia maritima TaxID=870908 RepID=A0A1M5K345_9RHOB|nr:hypothetical protein [Cognatishimia maritima]SHG47228.1 hypothetical protein SAMN04488044_0857 [Cognatishimia maritima]